jgi:hypothetical protein
MKYQKIDLKIGKEKLVVTELEDTKAIKMKSFYIMAEKTNDALKRGGKITEAKKLDYEKVQKLVQANVKTLLKQGKKFRVNVLTDEGWRGGKFTAKGQNLDWFDPSQYYDDAGEVDEIIMVQIQIL